MTGEVTLPEGSEMAVPGDLAEITVRLLRPAVLEAGMRFTVREGGVTVAVGRVTGISR